MAIYLGNKKVSMRGVVIDNSKLAQFVDGSLTEITAKDLEGATKIRKYGFYEGLITSIEIPESVTSIDPYAFYYCTKLTSIEIPESVTSIATYALNIGSFTNKATMRIHGETPPTIQSTTIGSNVEKIIVDPGTLSIWQNATNWSAKANIMEEEVV